MRWVEVGDKYTPSSRRFTRKPGQQGWAHRSFNTSIVHATSAHTLGSGRDACALFSPVMPPDFFQELMFSWKVEINQPILDPTRKIYYTVPR